MHLDYQSPSTPAPSPWRKRFAWLIPSPSVYMAALAFVTSGAVALWWPTTSLFCLPASAAALLIPLFDIPLRHLFKGGRLLIARAASLAFMAVMLAMQCSWSATTTFENAFGMAPPPGVKELTARARAAGPGDVAAFLRFRADRPTLDRLLAARGLKLETDYFKMFQTGELTWQEYRARTVDSFDRFGGQGWIPAGPPPTTWEWYEQQSLSPTTAPARSGTVNESVHLLYDRTTGQTWVLCLYG